MVKAVLLSSDQKLVAQIDSWMRELSDFVRLEKYRSEADFRAIIAGAPIESPASGSAKSPTEIDESETSESETDEEADENSEKSESAESDHDERLTIRLLIVDLDMIQQKPFQFVTELKKVLEDNGRCDPEHPTKVLLMAFENGAYRPETLRHEVIDDLILKPLDRTLFLQKIEILIADDPNVKPSFLFRQKTETEIEAGKDIVIDEISEFAVSIRNPAPIAPGVFAALHADVFGQKALGRVLGRAYESVRHPVREGEYLIRFSYFGMRAAQLSSVRQYVRDHQMQVKAKPPRGLKSTAENWIPPDSLRKFAIIDMDPEVRERLKTAIETTFKGVSTTSFPSYTRFIAELRRLTSVPSVDELLVETSDDGGADGMKGAAVSDADQEAAFPQAKFSLILAGEDRVVVRFEPMIGGREKILGRTSEEMLEQNDTFRNAVVPEDAENFDEFLSAVEKGAKGQAVVRMKMANGRVVYVECIGASEKSGEDDGLALMKVQVKELDEQAYRERNGILGGDADQERDPSAFCFDAIFIDGSMIRIEPDRWVDSLNEFLVAAGALAPGEIGPKIFVLADDTARLQPEEFRYKPFHHFILKPIERRTIGQKLKASFPSLQWEKESESAPTVAFIPTEMHAKLGKEVMMSQISEFGVTIIQPSPFKPRVFMRFYSPLFGDAAEGVIARCHYCEVNRESKLYECHFNFYGVGDDLLRRIRSWFLEDHVSKKEGQAG